MFFYFFPDERFFFLFLFLFSFLCAAEDQKLSGFCRRFSDRTATAIWTVCLSSIINIRAWDDGGGGAVRGAGGSSVTATGGGGSCDAVRLPMQLPPSASSSRPL